MFRHPFRRARERRNIQISIVIFDVDYKPYGSELDPEEALNHLFAFTPAVKLREGSSMPYYQSGSYTRDAPGTWSGRLERQKALKSTEIRRDPERGYIFTGQGRNVITFEAASQFAYFAPAGVIAYRDRGSMPYTRLRTYVRRASGPQEFAIDLIPRREHKRIEEWFYFLQEITAITASYQHSQSPGNRGIDKIMERYRAERIKETIRSKPNGSLDKQALLDKDLPLASVIDHIDQNRDNGDLLIEGRISGDSVKVDTSDDVSRLLVETQNDEPSIRQSLSETVRHLARTSGGIAR